MAEISFPVLTKVHLRELSEFILVQHLSRGARIDIAITRPGEGASRPYRQKFKTAEEASSVARRLADESGLPIFELGRLPLIDMRGAEIAE